MNLVNIKYEKNSFDNITIPNINGTEPFFIWSAAICAPAQHYLRKFDNQGKGHSAKVRDS